MPPSKKKSSKKGGKRNPSASAKSTSATRSNEEIIGNYWKTKIVKRSVIRELNEALVYESANDTRKELLAKIDSLDGKYVDETGATVGEMMPVTYETQPMINFTQKERYMLTVGKTAPFHIDKRYHGVPTYMMENAGYDAQDMENAKRWTGKEATLHMLLPNLSMGDEESAVFLGECYLDKEDTVHFANQFAKASSSFDWPDSFACHQCPFCCQMALPVVEKTRKTSIADGSYILIVQKIMQTIYTPGPDGKQMMQRVHRSLPRLCCKGCFEKNFMQEADKGEEFSYPGILQHDISLYAATDSMLSKGLVKIKRDEDDVDDEMILSAFSMFQLYDKCGMCSAVDEAIYVKTLQESQMMGLSVENLSVK
ncbi:hypothetical protein ACHAWT_006147 [Skeletonema menzelii]